MSKIKTILRESLLREDISNNGALIKELITLCCAELFIVGKVKVHLLSNKTEKVRTTAAFDTVNNEIFIYIKGRHIVDILRSIAHELKHLKQNQDGVLGPDSGNDGSEHENEANTFSGVMMRKFGELHPEIYE